MLLLDAHELLHVYGSKVFHEIVSVRRSGCHIEPLTSLEVPIMLR